MIETIVYKPKDVQQILGISQTKAYELFWSTNLGFNSFQIGKAHRILKTDFDAWVKQQVKKGK